MTQAAELLRSAEVLSRAGDTARAEAVLRQLLGQHPNNAAALNALAVMVLNQDKFDEAAALLERALQLRPKAPILHCNLAETHRRARRLEAAIKHARKALELRPDHIEALTVLGAAQLDLGDAAAALRCYEQAIGLDGGRTELHNNSGQALQRLDRLDEAEAAFRRAIALSPSSADGYNNLAGLLLVRGRFEGAEKACRKSMALAPGDVAKRINLARILMGAEKLADGRAIIDQVLRDAPNNADGLLVKAAFDLKRRDIDGALAAIGAALAIDPNRADAHALMGQALYDAGAFDQGLASHQRAVAISPASWEAQFSLGSALKDCGRFEEARASFLRCHALRPDRHLPYLSLAEVKRFRSNGDEDLTAMERAAECTMPAEELAYLHFSLAKAYDDLGRFSEASEQMLGGNALKRASIDYDEAKALRFFERLKRTFDAGTITRLSGAGARSELPIFIFGMPRSGTTLAEQIIASHPDVAGAGELELLDDLASGLSGENGAKYPEWVSTRSQPALTEIGEDFVRRLSPYAPAAARITDKAPSTYFYVGLVHLAMPGAKMVHTTRNAADTCLSCFSKLFGIGHDYSYELGELGRYYRAYFDLMRHWREVLPAGAFLDVRYEDVIADTENQARRILDFCDLDWDPRVLGFHKNDGVVRTLSAQQVRQPIYGSSVSRRRNYEAMLAPLLAELGDLA